MGDVIRVAIADDHPVVRRGLRAFLDSLDDIEVVGEAVDGEAAVRLAVTEEPDVLLLDLKMPKLDGIGVISRLRSRGASTRILVLTSFTAQQQVIPAIQAGADGYLLKDADPSELERAIRAVYRGEPLLAPEAAAAVMAAVSAQTADLPEHLRVGAGATARPDRGAPRRVAVRHRSGTYHPRAGRWCNTCRQGL